MIGPQNTTELRRFLKHLLISSKKIQEREGARKSLKEHVKTVKRVSIGGKKGYIDKALKELERKVSDVVDRENRLEIGNKKVSKTNADVKNRLDDVERKINGFIEEENKKIERLRAIEQKINAKVGSNRKEIMDIMNQIKRLDSVYEKLRYDENVDRSRLDSLRDRMDMYKEKLSRIS